MQQSSQAPADSIILKTTSDGIPQSGSCLLNTDSDMLAAVSCALYTYATGMVEKFGLGALHSVECHLSSGAVVIHRTNDCGDLWIQEVQPLPT